MRCLGCTVAQLYSYTSCSWGCTVALVAVAMLLLRSSSKVTIFSALAADLPKEDVEATSVPNDKAI